MTTNGEDSIFTYTDGTRIHEGDRVLVNSTRMASVELVITPTTDNAVVWQCPDTGGVLIAFDDGDKWLCRDGLDEDFQRIPFDGVAGSESSTTRE